MQYTIDYALYWHDGMGDGTDWFSQSFTDITDAIELLHQLQSRTRRIWDDEDGYTNIEDVVDARMSFVSPA